jgi:hypothetical protein
VTNEPAVEISAKGRDKPMVRNLPEVKPKTPLLESAVLIYHYRELVLLANLQ